MTIMISQSTIFIQVHQIALTSPAGYNFKALSCTTTYLNPATSHFLYINSYEILCFYTQICKLSLLISICKENLYVKMEKLEVQICRCTRQGLNVMPCSPGHIVQRMYRRCNLPPDRWYSICTIAAIWIITSLSLYSAVSRAFPLAASFSNTVNTMEGNGKS